ncbi:uncharacterized protein LY79DRAFT_131509 [Colletotrichum navitas]|uniref:Uncharacterized protein n=1 Tax=Colletotrichum navitas TaxID=681940 RepID=A0AAD8V681_9PEZI|nr:uncharacterized protein LY79DRAFT_131509 [Colletotrichum navitas]KAK1594529.1 hypothetical protein LY79DRAFT_131509 [Colletotrichum navitas]
MTLRRSVSTPPQPRLEIDLAKVLTFPSIHVPLGLPFLNPDTKIVRHLIIPRTLHCEMHHLQNRFAHPNVVARGSDPIPPSVPYNIPLRIPIFSRKKRPRPVVPHYTKSIHPHPASSWPAPRNTTQVLSDVRPRTVWDGLIAILRKCRQFAHTHTHTLE